MRLLPCLQLDPAPASGLLSGARGPTVRALLLGVVLLVVLPQSAAAQSTTTGDRQATEERLESLKAQIRETESRLKKTEAAAQASLQTLNQLERKIALREELVATYNRRVRELKRDRSALRDTLQRLQTRLDDLQAEYRDRAVHAYKYGRVHDLALILASRSVNQMLVRIRYLRQFATQRRSQESEIRAASQAVEARRESLAAKREKAESLLAEARREEANLRDLRAKRQQVVARLRSRSTELKAEIQEKQQQARQLEQQIREMVASAEESQQGSDAMSAAQRAELASLSASFQENRGRLPWPADGTVTESFGTHVSDYGTSTYRPGIFIATAPETPVRAVFQGTVTGIDFVPGYGTYLVVRHGRYLSVYSNFSRLRVSTGQRVDAGQILGRAGTSNEPRGAGLFFAVFDTSQNGSIDPMPWLATR